MGESFPFSRGSIYFRVRTETVLEKGAEASRFAPYIHLDCCQKCGALFSCGFLVMFYTACDLSILLDVGSQRQRGRS